MMHGGQQHLLHVVNHLDRTKERTSGSPRRNAASADILFAGQCPSKFPAISRSIASMRGCGFARIMIS